MSMTRVVVGHTELTSSREAGLALGKEIALKLDGAAPDVQWEIVADNLNIHLSESVVRIVAHRCGVTQDLGRKHKHGILTRRAAQLNRAPAGKPSCAMPITASASILRQSTPPGSTRSNSGSPFSPARS